MKVRFSQQSQVDLFVLVSMVFLLFMGLLMMFLSPDIYRDYVAEDGPIEWISTLFLFNCAILCMERLVSSSSSKKRKVFYFYLVMTAAFLFGVGEELSWGQRIFNIESSDFFLEHNWQKEMNIHNLYFQHLNVNKVVFGTIMGLIIGGYLFLLPWLYRAKNKIGKLVDQYGVPVPRLYQVLCILGVSLLVQLVHAPDKWELMELAGSMTFFLIFLNPVNKEQFKLV